jgi:hypothetical protein
MQFVGRQVRNSAVTPTALTRVLLCFSSVSLRKYGQSTLIREAPLPTLFQFVIQHLYNSTIATTDITQSDITAAL